MKIKLLRRQRAVQRIFRKNPFRYLAVSWLLGGVVRFSWLVAFEKAAPKSSEWCGSYEEVNPIVFQTGETHRWLVQLAASTTFWVDSKFGWHCNKHQSIDSYMRNTIKQKFQKNSFNAALCAKHVPNRPILGAARVLHALASHCMHQIFSNMDATPRDSISNVSTKN